MINTPSKLLRVQYPRENLPQEPEDTSNVPRELQESALQVDCSFESSNDAPLCDFATSYGLCDYLQSDSENQQPSLQSLTGLYIPFDYELHYATLSREAPIDFVKGFLMQHLALNFGLESCEVSQANGERSRSLATENELSALPVVGMSTGQPDQLDNGVECTAPVEKDIKEISECRRIEGQVLLYIDQAEQGEASSELLIRSSVLKAIREIMLDDQLLVSSSGDGGAIHQVIFMGQRRDDLSGPVGTAPTTLSDSRNQDSSKNTSGLSAVGIIIILLGVISFVLLGVLAIVKSKRSSKADPVFEGPLDEESDTEAESPKGSLKEGRFSTTTGIAANGISNKVDNAATTPSQTPPRSNIEVPLGSSSMEDSVNDETKSFPTLEISVPKKDSSLEDDEAGDEDISVLQDMPIPTSTLDVSTLSKEGPEQDAPDTNFPVPVSVAEPFIEESGEDSPMNMTSTTLESLSEPAAVTLWMEDEQDGEGGSTKDAPFVFS